MTSKIETVDITEERDPNSGLVKLSEIRWEDYLAMKNYNQDINKMCELCIIDQKKKYGKQTIPCNGLLGARNHFGDELYEDIIEGMDTDGINTLESIYDPYSFMEHNVDLEKKGEEGRVFIPRWYQEMLTRCSAKSKVVRMGRRTGKTMSLAILILHKCITNENHRALLVSPFQNQTEEVIDNLKKLCSMLPENPILSSKASPVHVIKFKNGSMLKGFTAALNGNSIRGQPADSIWLDEIDDIPQTAITSIMGILMGKPDVEMWRSGTPKGEMNLHKAAQSSSTKEFHYPSFVIPHYKEDIDKQLRNDMDEIGYIQEAMAEFGAVSNGVFQHLFINRATERARFLTPMEVLGKRNDYIIIAGVDWNHDKVGTRIVVVAYDRHMQDFNIVEKEKVAVEGWTQQEAMERIININRKYSLDHLFVDAGFGATQIGDLRSYGELRAADVKLGRIPKGHPDVRLMDLQSVDYGSNIELQDPTSGETFKQGLKQFAVQNCVLLLEKNKLALNPKDDDDIIKQMKNYIEKSRLKGKSTYGYISKKIGDHDLDALMIALYGFKKEYSSIFIGSSTQVMMRLVAKSEGNEDSDPHDMYGEHDVDFGPTLKFGNRGLAKSSQRVLKLGIKRNSTSRLYR